MKPGESILESAPMKRTDLIYHYPDKLVAIEPSRPTRVMWVDPQNSSPEELTIDQLIDKIPSGDVFVINNTKVLKRRVFTDTGLEILFLNQEEDKNWNVLFPAKKINVGDEINLPGSFKMTLLSKGLPQKVSVFPEITDSDFERIAELPLPPYIQKARHERHNNKKDDQWYQTAWAQKSGSLASPTASLHFTAEHIQKLKERNVVVLSTTLHVGLGTFLPVKADDLDHHEMHAEVYDVDQKVWEEILFAKKNNRGIWALGTTVTRTLETVARTGNLSGESQLLLQPGSDFKIVNRLLTNFHQPESTLLALVSAFSNLETVKKNYQWAIEREFKLFSYGDLSVWLSSHV